MQDRMTTPTLEEYHEALNGLWIAFGPEFRQEADLYVVQRMIDVLRRGHACLALPISAAIEVAPDETA